MKSEPPAARQLAFDLPARSLYQRDDFFTSPANASALAALEDWRRWPGGKLVLTGPEGAGKTHLAHVWAAMAGGRIIAARDLARLDLSSLAGAVVVEDAAGVAGDREAETALFHLHNLVTAGGHLLLTASRPPRDWGLTLPDLASRLMAAPLAQLQAPDDALLAAVLVKLFADRQIAVNITLIRFLTARMDRSIGAARALVAALDAAALARGGKVSRALAAEVLGRLE
jgi:chromosomal replication initiation ATPase DnaA